MIISLNRKTKGDTIIIIFRIHVYILGLTLFICVRNIKQITLKLARINVKRLKDHT